VRDNLQQRAEDSTEYELYRRYNTGTRFVEDVRRVLKALKPERDTKVLIYGARLACYTLPGRWRPALPAVRWGDLTTLSDTMRSG